MIAMLGVLCVGLFFVFLFIYFFPRQFCFHSVFPNRSYLQVFIYRLCELSPYPAIRYAFNVSVCFWFCASSLTKSSCVCSVVYFAFFMACTVLLFKSVRPNAFYLFCVLLMFLTALSEECMACFTFRHLD